MGFEMQFGVQVDTGFGQCSKGTCFGNRVCVCVCVCGMVWCACCVLEPYPRESFNKSSRSRCGIWLEGLRRVSRCTCFRNMVWDGVGAWGPQGSFISPRVLHGCSTMDALEQFAVCQSTQQSSRVLHSLCGLRCLCRVPLALAHRTKRYVSWGKVAHIDADTIKVRW